LLLLLSESETSYPKTQFSCSICLDMFKDPVTTECEHDFCRPCITEYWDREETSICPLCRQYSSGTLRTNRTLACVVEILHSKKQPCGEEYETSSDSNFGFLLLVVLIFVIVLLWSLSPDSWVWAFLPPPPHPGICHAQRLISCSCPPTAHHSLILFDNQSSVVSGTGPNGAPTGPSRFLVHPFVLAKCGFSSGIHYWEVSVGNKPDWVLGIAKKSVNRKTAIQLTPQNGLWALEKTSMYYLAHSQPRVLIFTGVKPKKIGIYLDYESGQVCFYNADNMSFMYMFKDTFTETVYPLFSPGLGFRPLRILHNILPHPPSIFPSTHRVPPV
uniref:B30.2/SPRY domain-containing protein n=1 Tax=Callorhinchus milii TaxID=7868 RepID=A0A4W3HWY2_CALMI